MVVLWGEYGKVWVSGYINNPKILKICVYNEIWTIVKISDLGNISSHP